MEVTVYWFQTWGSEILRAPLPLLEYCLCCKNELRLVCGEGLENMWCTAGSIQGETSQYPPNPPAAKMSKPSHSCLRSPELHSQPTDLYDKINVYCVIPLRFCSYEFHNIITLKDNRHIGQVLHPVLLFKTILIDHSLCASLYKF